MQFADTHCGAEVLKVGVCNKFYRSAESGCLQ
jgi:hypothetical protein